MTVNYLSSLPREHAQRLTEVNAPGISALHSYMESGKAVAILGAGVSVPLYPLWKNLISELVDLAHQRGLSTEVAETCRLRLDTQPDAVVELLRRQLGVHIFRDILRAAFRVRRDPVTGQSWTRLHELICQQSFNGIITTNYDSGILDARMHVRPSACSTGFTSWADETALDRWINGDVFTDDELPVLFAHGYHTRPDEMILATSEYRRAYAGKLSETLSVLIRTSHMVWMGFSYRDQHVTSILQEVLANTGTRSNPGGIPRHVTLLPWIVNSAKEYAEDPRTLCSLIEIEYGSYPILYPVWGEDHSSLGQLLTQTISSQYSPAYPSWPDWPDTDRKPDTRSAMSLAKIPAESNIANLYSNQELQPIGSFAGRTEELGRLTRWHAEDAVKVIAVVAWAGAGKTALVTKWIYDSGLLRRGRQKIFIWDFYANPSVREFMSELISQLHNLNGLDLPAKQQKESTEAKTAVSLLCSTSVLILLDGLEVIQEGLSSQHTGQFHDSRLRDFLVAFCRTSSDSLILLTSRIPIADIERFDGQAARILDLPPLADHEGATLLERSGADWLPAHQREILSSTLNGHALALTALSGCLERGSHGADLNSFIDDLTAKVTTDSRVRRVLQYYLNLLDPADRSLLACVSLFRRPVGAEVIMTVAAHHSFGGQLDGWTARDVEARVRARMSGLLSADRDGKISAHPLIRDTFRPLAMGATEIAVDITLAGIPVSVVENREQARQVVEAIELCIDANQWHAANELYVFRSRDGRAWQTLPAAQLGLRACMAFIETPERRSECQRQLNNKRLVAYLGDAGMLAIFTGNLSAGKDFLEARVRATPEQEHAPLARGLCDLAVCTGRLGRPLAGYPLAHEALDHAEATADGVLRADAHVAIAWLAFQYGETSKAEQYFILANRIEYGDNSERIPHSQVGIWWSDFLVRTGRRAAAYRLTQGNLRICEQLGHNEDIARCLLMLAKLDLDRQSISHRTMSNLRSAIDCFRDGQYLYEFAEAMLVAAECERQAQMIGAANDRLADVSSMYGLLDNLPVKIPVLIQQSSLLADRSARGEVGCLQRARDIADSAFRLSSANGLAWFELDAVNIHARIDEVEQADHGWMSRAKALRRRLVPSDLEDDPLRRIEAEFSKENLR